ncbi:WbqC family protein [Methanosarcina mazei]|uniref:WbqC-like protein family protein n=1 Tax=Methanosarcina mazei SarPi TaxID=1434115 RepID=A0A0E3RD28_METMZ|nr:WbqC family protein [Methanosarcina mazei]AKB62442.1 hypothetical protein MSMAP_2457 [Methanosarcina mazei SarPi]
MIVAIHQPNYLPYLGFFDKMMKADIFVIYDDAQFNKEDFQHRNKIRIYHGWKWLTVPVEKKPIPINEIKIRNEITTKNIKWSDAHIKYIEDEYKKSDYYLTYKTDLEKIYRKSYGKLIDLNMEIISYLKDAFDIDTKIIFSSKFGFESTSTQKLIDIVEALEGDTYLSGSGGRNYLEISLFKNRGIEVNFQDFKHPIYRQTYRDFIPNMSAIDALFNTGKMKS